MRWQEVPITICMPSSLPSDYFKKPAQCNIKNTFDTTSNLGKFDKLVQSRSYLYKQSEIRPIEGKYDLFEYWKIVEQVTSSIKDKLSARVSLVTFEYGHINYVNGDIVENASSKIFFQIQITNYNVLKDGYFTEVHLNLDKTCIALVSQSSCCVCHLPCLANESISSVNSKEFGTIHIIPKAFTGYTLQDVHFYQCIDLCTADEKDLRHKIASHVVKVKWHLSFNNLICILEKNSYNKSNFQTYFRIYNVSESIDVPVYKLKIDSSAWKNTFYRTIDYNHSNGLYNMCYLDERDVSFDTNVKLEYENSGNIVDFTMGIRDPENVWQEYTLYLLHEYGYIYIYTPIIFFDLKLSNEDRMKMISNTTYHLFNSNSISAESLSQEFYTELNLLLYNSSELIPNPRLICTSFSRDQELNTSFVILSYVPIFIFGIINSAGTLLIFTSDFSLFPPVPALSNYWSQSIDSVCIYTINYMLLNPVLFPIPDSQESVLIYSTKSYYILSLNMATSDGSKILENKFESYFKNKEADNILELTFGGCKITLFNSVMSKLDQGCSIYSHPCYIHTNAAGEISVFVSKYTSECKFMKSSNFCAIKPIIEGTAGDAISNAFIMGEIEKLELEFRNSIGKIRDVMALKASMINNTFDILVQLQLLHRKINKFNNLEKFYSDLLIKVKETHEDNIKNTVEHIESFAKHSSKINSSIQQGIERISKSNDVIKSRCEGTSSLLKKLVEKTEWKSVKVYCNNFIARIDCIIAEFIHLYLQYQCIECVKLRARARGYETIKDKPVLCKLGPSTAVLEHLLSSRSYCGMSSTSFLRLFSNSPSFGRARSTISQLSRSQKSRSQASRKEALEMKLSCDEKIQELSCENCTALKYAFKKYVFSLNSIVRGLNEKVH